jgi:hypothetical protein|nr:MAG TPA: TIR-like domain protein [Caudoviricetes sp.]
MPELKTYDLFISHAWKYGDEYCNLIYLLDKAPCFSYRNYSAPSDKPLHNLDNSDVRTQRQIKDAIGRKILPVNIVVVISGMYANNRKWMEYEIECAQNFRKPLIAIRPWGNSITPIYIQNAAEEVVGWNTNSIVQAIRKYSI